MTRYEAFTSSNWRASGIAQVVVARIRDDGRAEIGFFLVDHWCLGVKDAYLRDDSSESELRELLRDQLAEEDRERIHPACARKLIEGAVAYAESLGFAPHRDFRKAKRVLSGLSAPDCPETFTYGRDGKPFYVEGPDDPSDRTERVLASLTRRFGPDGFGFELLDDDLDDDVFSDADFDSLDYAEQITHVRAGLHDLLDPTEPPAPNFYEFAGLVAALHACPQTTSPAALIRLLQQDHAIACFDEAEAKRFFRDLTFYWNYIAEITRALQGDLGDHEHPHALDIYPSDFDDLTDQELKISHIVEATVDWCAGFLRATRDWPELWEDALECPDLRPHWDLLRAWATPDDPESSAIINEGSDLSPNTPAKLPRAVVAIIRALRGPA